MTPTIEEIRKLVALQLGKRRVAADDRLVEDLGAESIDLVSLVATVEDRYDVEVAEEELAALRTVADVHALTRRGTGG
jgi:acyl carrier protein